MKSLCNYLKTFNIILGLLLGQLILAQNNDWYDDYLPKDYNPKLYLITDSGLIKYYHDTIKAYEISINKDNEKLITFRDNSDESEIEKIVTVRGM